jgi:acylphosphatase
MTQAHILITGKVQGVGYRQYLKSHAKKLTLFGWVQNLPDGSVEALVQGEKENIDDLIAMCKIGPFMSDVVAVNVSWEIVRDVYPDFVIYKTEFHLK